MPDLNIFNNAKFKSNLLDKQYKKILNNDNNVSASNKTENDIKS